MRDERSKTLSNQSDRDIHARMLLISKSSRSRTEKKSAEKMKSDHQINSPFLVLVVHVSIPFGRRSVLALSPLLLLLALPGRLLARCSAAGLARRGGQRQAVRRQRRRPRRRATGHPERACRCSAGVVHRQLRLHLLHSRRHVVELPRERVVVVQRRRRARVQVVREPRLLHHRRPGPLREQRRQVVVELEVAAGEVTLVVTAVVRHGWIGRRSTLQQIN
jgi:hypothetical protein